MNRWAHYDPNWRGRVWENGGMDADWCPKYRCRLCQKLSAQVLAGLEGDRICPWCCQSVGRKICEAVGERPGVGFFESPDDWQAYREANRDHSIVPAQLRARILERDGSTCQHCGVTDNLHIDHKIPSSRGGRLDEENLWVLCAQCNSSKRAKTVEEWLAHGGRKRIPKSSEAQKEAA